MCFHVATLYVVTISVSHCLLNPQLRSYVCSSKVHFHMESKSVYIVPKMHSRSAIFCTKISTSWTFVIITDVSIFHISPITFISLQTYSRNALPCIYTLSMYFARTKNRYENIFFSFF